MSPQRRGRPPGRPVDPTPSEGAAFHSEVRIGWLLRSWRLAAQPESSARSFATVLTGLDQSADASRVSRWETGQLAAPLDVVRAYEQALHAPPGSLAALALSTRLLPASVDEVSTGLPEHRFSIPELERLLDLVLDGTPTGADWFDFAVLVASRPDRVTLAMSTWRTLTAALVKELGLSVGNAYITRDEAAKLLTAQPRAKQALVQSIGEYVMNPESLLVVDLLALLTAMDNPPAGDLVLRLLEQQPPGPVLNGAVWAASSKVSRGQLGADELGRLERVVVRLLQEGQEAGGLFHRLADLVAVLPEDVRARVSRAAGQRRDLPRSRPETPGRWSRRQVAHLCEVLAETDGYDDDPLLERLLEEAVFHTNAERRFQAALTLTFSPYRDRLGTACAALVRSHLDGTQVLDALLAERVMLLLTFVGGAAQRDLLHRVVGSGPDNLVAPALVGVAHLPPSTDRPDLEHLLAAGNDEVAQPAMYCAGMTGHPCLDGLALRDDLPEWVRRAAVWWRREGPAIHEP